MIIVGHCMDNYKIHPLNAKGKYYIDQDTCSGSAACEYHAPKNFKFEDGYFFVVKQPETAEEEKQCQEAMNACPVEAIHDDGEK